METATLSCKILALWMFAQAATSFAYPIFSLILTVGSFIARQSNSSSFLVAAVIAAIPGLGMLVAGTILWFKAGWFAVRMVGDDLAHIPAAAMNPETVLAVSFAVIGVYVLTYVLQDLTALVVREVHDTGHDSWTTADWSSASSAFTGLAISAWLILGSRGLARLVLWARSAIPKPPQETP
jgi:hypothetical protein